MKKIKLFLPFVILLLCSCSSSVVKEHVEQTPLVTANTNVETVKANIDAYNLNRALMVMAILNSAMGLNIEQESGLKK